MKNFSQLAFTPAIKDEQEKHGSRGSYARMEQRPGPAGLGVAESEFISERDSFYIASVTETGWPYVQHRGGPAGFLHVLDPQTIAFADFTGNRQYISVGNLRMNPRVALFLMDYPNQTRLKILGHAEIRESTDDPVLAEKVAMPEYKARVERVIVIHVDAFDWNCPQHITPRYTAAQVEQAVEPLRRRLAEVEEENRVLKAAAGQP
jgi:predicted pyridoxine 5'-phosphate oxidase superfamily flavin-nucleotide-binding protein